MGGVPCSSGRGHKAPSKTVAVALESWEEGETAEETRTRRFGNMFRPYLNSLKDKPGRARKLFGSFSSKRRSTASAAEPEAAADEAADDAWPEAKMLMNSVS